MYIHPCEYRFGMGTGRGLGRAKPGPSRLWWLWLGLDIEEAKAASGQAKAGAFGPSRARQITNYRFQHQAHTVVEQVVTLQRAGIFQIALEFRDR